MSLLLRLVGNTTTYTIDRIETLSLEKEAYTPYSSLSLTTYVTHDPENFTDIFRVTLFNDDEILHDGTIQKLTATRQENMVRLSLTSRSFTAMLLQNQIAPGIHTAFSLDALMTSIENLPEEIEWEHNSDTSNYLYVRQNVSIWDGIVALTYKICGRYPFLCGANEIRMHFPEQYKNWTATESTALKAGVITDQSILYSDFYMADAAGTYGAYHYHDDEATARGITRTKQLDLDDQYLYNPEEALIFRDKFAARRLVRKFVEVSGIAAVSLGDRLSYESMIENDPVTRIRLAGDKNGLRTRMETYQDKFYPDV